MKKFPHLTDAISWVEKTMKVNKNGKIAGCGEKDCEYCQHEVDEIHIVEFHNVDSFIEFCSTPRSKRDRRCSSRNTDEASWYGTKDFEEARDLAKKGWEKDFSEFDDLRRIIFEKVTNEIIHDKFYLDVEGDDFDIPSVILGVPEQWWNTTNRLASQRKKVVTINANVSASCGVDASFLNIKGASLMAIIEALQIAGLSTEVRLTQSTSNRTYGPSRVYEQSVIIKHADAPFDYKRMMFFLAHPASLRRLFFSAIESAIPDDWVWLSSGYGYPWKSSYSADIMIPHATLANQNCNNIDAPDFGSPESASEWIKEQIKKQGIRFLD